MPTIEDLSEIPAFKSHKVVRALQIARRRNRTIWFSDVSFGSHEFPDEMFHRFKPEAGDYLVIYEDGYMSFSPKKAFEEGYTPIDKAERAALSKNMAMIQAPPTGAAEAHPDITRSQYLRLKATEHVLEMLKILNGNPDRGQVMLWIDCTYDYLRTGKLQGDANGDTAQG